MKEKKVIALLDSMWNWQGFSGGEPVRFFTINPNNVSGKRLYRLVGENVELLVTNSCREIGSHANAHGKPDANWVAENLRLLEPFDLLLVCGLVAKQTYLSKVFAYQNVLIVDHPAARRWSHVTLEQTAQAIQRKLQ